MRSVGRPKPIVVAALTAGLWSAWFVLQAADPLLDGADRGQSLLRLLGGGAAALFGAAVCLLLDRGLVRLRFTSAGAAIGLLLAATAGLAAVWGGVANGVLFPLARAAIERGGLTMGSPLHPAPSGAPTVWWLFLAWIGVWAAIAYGDALRQAEERIVDLEALLGEDRTPGGATHLWAPTRSGNRRVPVEAVIRLEAERDYVRLLTADGDRALVRSSLQSLIARLGSETFLRVHRSSAVNRRHVAGWRRVSGGLILDLSDGDTVRVGRRRTAEVLAALDA